MLDNSILNVALPTIGRELHGPSDNRWFSFGLRLTPDRFL